MAIGERIRFLRNLRGMTQKQLGISVGFPESSADVRLAQYESGSRTPKESMTKIIADSLDVSPLALTVPDINTHLGFMHTLFATEDIYSLIPSIKDGRVTLTFSNLRVLDQTFMKSIYEWAEMSDKYRAGEITKEEYDNWRYHYPDFEKSQLWEKVPPQWLTDLFVNSGENK